MMMVNRGGRPARQAISLLELLAVVTIIAIIASIVVPRLATSTYTAKMKMCLQYRGDINSAIERYMFDKGTPPTQLSDLESDGYYSDTIPNCPADNTAYTIDSVTNRVSGHDH